RCKSSVEQERLLLKVYALLVKLGERTIARPVVEGAQWPMQANTSEVITLKVIAQHIQSRPSDATLNKEADLGPVPRRRQIGARSYRRHLHVKKSQLRSCYFRRNWP